MNAATAPYALTIEEAAAYVGVSVTTLRRAIHSDGKNGGLPPLPARRVGSRYSITRTDQEAWHATQPHA